MSQIKCKYNFFLEYKAAIDFLSLTALSITYSHLFSSIFDGFLDYNLTI